MVDLVLRPSSLVKDRPWALQLRWHESLGETEYRTLVNVTEATAREIIRAGGARWMFGEPPDDQKYHGTSLERAIAEARAWYEAMTPEQREAHDRAQRESWVRGMMPTGDPRFD